MELDFPRTVWFPILFGMVGIAVVAIGIRGLTTKRPLLFSGRWAFCLLLIVFAPMFLHPLFSRSTDFLDGLPLLLFAFFFLIWWHQTKGYMALAVTDQSFREALLAALEKLQLPYKESLSSIRLPSIDADLQVAVQSWVGTGQIKVKPSKHRLLLTEIIKAMNDYFRTSSARPNVIFCVSAIIFGILVVFMAVDLLFL